MKSLRWKGKPPKHSGDKALEKGDVMNIPFCMGLLKRPCFHLVRLYRHAQPR
ncbi:hypothetical protein HMPREF1487_04815 [Pseudomonas sp. HPB0071]|nr:hypothetical protein HMPREF1487_04815 [Pseudomonas sp. HPB0071]SHI32734.1 hypothetical protein SAMN05216295_101222 [Pseudomonas zeshuii]